MVLEEALRNTLHSDRSRKSFPVLLNMASGIFAAESKKSNRTYMFSHTEVNYDKSSDKLFTRTYIRTSMAN